MTENTSKKTAPMVSVFMPVYNQENVVRESIDSIINQTYQDWELIIGDDCSTDKTYEIALEYQQQYPYKIKVFKNEKNLGITGNCNELLRRCTGKYIAFTAGDDLFLPTKLEKQVSVMEGGKNTVLSYHDVEVFEHGTGKVIKYWNQGDYSSRAISGSTDVLVNSLVLNGTSFMAALSVMVKRDAIPDCGYDPRVPISSDWLMWIEICTHKQGEVIFLKDVLARYRKSASSITAKPHLWKHEKNVILSILEEKYFRSLWRLIYIKRTRLYSDEAIEMTRNGLFSEARKVFLFCAMHEPKNMIHIRRWLGSWLKQLGIRPNR